MRQIDRRRQQSRRRKKNKGRVIESDRKRKLLAQNFQKVGILFLQKNPRHFYEGMMWGSQSIHTVF